jgi:hypothetical protein
VQREGSLWGGSGGGLGWMLVCDLLWCSELWLSLYANG